MECHLPKWSKMIQNDPKSIFILFLKLLGNRLNRPGESWRIPTMAKVGTTAGPLASQPSPWYLCSTAEQPWVKLLVARSARYLDSSEGFLWTTFTGEFLQEFSVKKTSDSPNFQEQPKSNVPPKCLAFVVLLPHLRVYAAYSIQLCPQQRFSAHAARAAGLMSWKCWGATDWKTLLHQGDMRRPQRVPFGDHKWPVIYNIEFDHRHDIERANQVTMMSRKFWKGTCASQVHMSHSFTSRDL